MATDRKTKIWICALVVFGIPLLAIFLNPSPEASQVVAPAPVPKSGPEGPKPDVIVISMTITESIRQSANDPGSLQGPDMYEPEIAKVGKEACWRVPFSYRLKNGFGGLMLYHGSVWIKGDRILRQKWS